MEKVKELTYIQDFYCLILLTTAGPDRYCHADSQRHGLSVITAFCTQGFSHQELPCWGRVVCQNLRFWNVKRYLHL